MSSTADLTFLTIARPTESSQTNALLLAESIREFGGALAENPIWCCVPEHGDSLSESVAGRLDALGVTTIGFGPTVIFIPTGPPFCVTVPGVTPVM